MSTHGSSGRERSLSRRYLAIVAAMAIVLCALTLAINTAVDPLWFGPGNVVSGENWVFNERIARLNHFLPRKRSYDCLIFGSSRLTLLDERHFRQHRCANLSFSGGNILEFVEYARYLKARGVSPQVVYIGIDTFGFINEQTVSESPDFVRESRDPPGLVRSYLSWSVLWFSLRELWGTRNELYRYYDEYFVGSIFPGTGPYQPPNPMINPSAHRFDTSRVRYYRELSTVFPQAKFVGIISPVSAWESAMLYLDSEVDPYFGAVHELVSVFDEFYDFTAPSPTTERTDNTYDGSHYDPNTYDRVIAILEGAQPTDFGTRVTRDDFDSYCGRYRSAVEQFLARVQPQALAPARSHDAHSAKPDYPSSPCQQQRQPDIADLNS